MKMPKPSDDDRERFSRLVPDDPSRAEPIVGQALAFVGALPPKKKKPKK